MNIRLTHIDGKLPNLALMKLAHWHRARGDDVFLGRLPTPGLFETAYDKVYASAIFDWSKPFVERLKVRWPEAVVAGTGSGNWRTVEDELGVESYEHYDYSIYPGFPWSLGFTQRGCRLNCGFCVVPKKEGRPKSVNTIWDIWRPDSPRCVMLLDNDFFGQPRIEWEARISELREGGFKVCFNQGVNIRLITPESAVALASVRYFDDGFERHRLYTAWDNLKDEEIFFRGVALLQEAGIPPKHLMVYMLVGYRKGETIEEILYRYHRLKGLGCMPFPMVYRDSPDYVLLRRFARWVIRRYDSQCSFDEFGSNEQERRDPTKDRQLPLLKKEE